MAITALDYLVVSTLRNNRAFRAKPKIIELGESNWYTDVPADQLMADIQTFADPAMRESLSAELRDSVEAKRKGQLYEVARIWFKTFFDPSLHCTIDPGTPDATYPYDLNRPVKLNDRFDVVLNIGTAEHIFDVCQFFRTVHELTIEGGLMIHASPYTGWPDHGFFNFQPTLYFDLARANRYEILLYVIARLDPFQFVQVTSHAQIPALIKDGKVPPTSMISVVLKKSSQPVDFAIPVQGYYAGALSAEGADAWNNLR